MRTALLREVVPAERPAKGPACRSARRDTPHGGDPARGQRLRAGPGHTLRPKELPKGPACRSTRRDTPPRRRPGKRPAPKGRTRDTRSGRKNRRRGPPAGVRGETRPPAETRRKADAEEPDPGRAPRRRGETAHAANHDDERRRSEAGTGSESPAEDHNCLTKIHYK